jgi:hypothetical protein
MNPRRPAVPVDGLNLEPIELNGQSLDLNYYFGQDYLDIEHAAKELPAVVEWVNAQYHVIYEDMLTFKDDLERAEARAFFDLKDGGYAQKYGGKATEKSLEHAITLDDRVIALKKNYNNLRGWVKRLYALQESLQTKLELVRSSEATRRRLVEAPELELGRPRQRRTDSDIDEKE